MTDTEEERSSLAHQLREWKTQWTAEHDGQRPTGADLRKDATASALFTRYVNLRPACPASSSSTGTADPPPPGRLERLAGFARSTPKQHFFTVALGRASMGDCSPILDSKLGDSLSVAPPEGNLGPLDDKLSPRMIHMDFFSYPVEMEPADLENNKTIAKRASERGDQHEDNARSSALSQPQAKRKNELSRELLAWKSEFQAQNGRPPTTSDYGKHPRIARLYGEYKRLRAVKYGQYVPGLSS